MLGSSVRALAARVMIQKRVLEAPNGLAYAPKGVHAYFDRVCVHCASFVHHVRFGRL